MTSGTWGLPNHPSARNDRREGGFTPSGKRALRLSYLMLLLGALAVVAVFALSTRAWEQRELSRGVLWIHLWVASPALLCALNTFVISRFIYPGREGSMFLSGTALFLASGALIYFRALAAGAEGAMEAVLVFIFGPLYHFAAVALITAGYLARSFWLMLQPGGEEAAGE